MLCFLPGMPDIRDMERTLQENQFCTAQRCCMHMLCVPTVFVCVSERERGLSRGVWVPSGSTFCPYTLPYLQRSNTECSCTLSQAKERCVSFFGSGQRSLHETLYWHRSFWPLTLQRAPSLYQTSSMVSPALWWSTVSHTPLSLSSLSHTYTYTLSLSLCLYTHIHTHKLPLSLCVCVCVCLSLSHTHAHTLINTHTHTHSLSLKWWISVW